MAMDDKQSRKIIDRLDTLILQQEDRPEVYTMERVSNNIDSIDITTRNILGILEDVHQTNKEIQKQNMSLFERIGERWTNGTNQLHSTLISLVDTIKTTLDYKGHFRRAQELQQKTFAMIGKGFIQVRKNLSDGLANIVWSMQGMRMIMSKFNKAQADLNGYLESGKGSNAPLTVGYISNLYSKILTYENLNNMRNRKLAQKKHVSTTKFLRNMSADLKRLTDHFTDEQKGWFAKLMFNLGSAFKFMGEHITSLGGALSALTFAFQGKWISKLNPVLNAATKGLGFFAKGLGTISSGVGGLLHDFTGTVGMWLRSLVGTVFTGIGRVVTMMLNPVVLVSMLAGYSIYKIFEEEFDHLFGGIKAIFSNPENREAVWSGITQWFNGIVDSIIGWFGSLGQSVAEMLPDGMMDSIVGAFQSGVGFVKKVLNGYVNGLNKIIATFASIPDAFSLLGMGIESMILSIKEMIGGIISGLPDWMTPDSLKEKFNTKDLEAERSALTAKQDDVRARVDKRYEEQYVQDTAAAVGNAVKAGVGNVVDGVVNLKDNIGGGITSLGDAAYNYADKLQAERDQKAKADQLKVEQERAAWREAQMEAGKVAVAQAKDRVVEGTKNIVTQVTDGSVVNNMMAPLRTFSSAKVANNRGATR